MTRFEEENGGQLLIASLCLLECSCRGLLETELLNILGDEDNLMPGKNKSGEKGQEGNFTEKVDSEIKVVFVLFFGGGTVYFLQGRSNRPCL